MQSITSNKSLGRKTGSTPPQTDLKEKKEKSSRDRRGMRSEPDKDGLNSNKTQAGLKIERSRQAPLARIDGPHMIPQTKARLNPRQLTMRPGLNC